MREFTKVISAGPAFFLSAWFLMLFAGSLSGDTGLKPIGYLTSMVATIALWLVIAPAAEAIARATKRRR